MPQLERRVVLVAGMHRSGTSAVARVLNLLGAEIPGELVPGSDGNERGHWEPRAVVDLHDEMLRSAQSNVNSVFGVDEGWFASQAAAGQADRVARFLEGALADTPLAVIKDPRLALFVPVWRRALERAGVQGSFVFPFRDPLEVAASLQRRQRRFYPDAVWPLGRGVLLWLRYVLEAERHARGAPRSFVGFEDLLADWCAEARRIGAQLDIEWPRPADAATAEVEAFLSRELKHETAPDGAEGFPLAYAVLDQLKACTVDPEAGAQVFDAARGQLDAAGDLYGQYLQQLELTVGAHPRLRTEYVDFLGARGTEPPRDAEPATDPLPGFETADEPRRNALLISARANARMQAATIAELEMFNQALLDAARWLEAAHASAQAEVERRAHAAETELAAIRREIADLRSAHAQAQAQRASALADAERARAELLSAAERAEALQSELAARGDELETLTQSQRRSEADIRRLQGESERLQDEVQRLRAEAAQLRETLNARIAETEALRASPVWRLTAPARALARSLKPANKGA